MGARSNYLADLANENSSLTIQLQFEEKTNMAVQHISTPYPFGIQYDNLQGNGMKEKFWNFQKLSLRSSCTFYRLQLMRSLDLFAIQKPICIPSSESKQTG